MYWKLIHLYLPCFCVGVCSSAAALSLAAWHVLARLNRTSKDTGPWRIESWGHESHSYPHKDKPSVSALWKTDKESSVEILWNAKGWGNQMPIDFNASSVRNDFLQHNGWRGGKMSVEAGLWEIKGPRCSVDTHTYTHNERMLYVIHILLERDWETESRRRREVEIQWLYLLRLLYTPSNVLFNALWFWFLFNLKCLQEPFVVTDWAQITSDTRNYDAMPVASWCNCQSWQITLLGEGRAFFLVDHNDHCHCFLLLKSEDFCFISLSTEYLRVFDCSVKRSPAALEGHFSLFSQFVLDLNWKNDRQIHQ